MQKPFVRQSGIGAPAHANKRLSLLRCCLKTLTPPPNPKLFTANTSATERKWEVQKGSGDENGEVQVQKRSWHIVHFNPHRRYTAKIRMIQRFTQSEGHLTKTRNDIERISGPTRCRSTLAGLTFSTWLPAFPITASTHSL